MEQLFPGATLFETQRPAVLELPHLVTALDAEWIGKLKHLTACRPGIWNISAPFDAEDRFDPARESAPFDWWGLPLNQGEVLAFSPLVQEAVFGGKTMFLDSEFSQDVLTRLAVSPGRRLEGGAWVTRGYEDLPELDQLVEQCHWVLIPLGAERSLALFVVSRAKADWIVKLEEWCDHDGRNHGRFQAGPTGVELALRTAPENYRLNAIGHHVDLFLSRLEIYFGKLERPISTLVEDRIESRRQLQQRIEAAKSSSPAGG